MQTPLRYLGLDIGRRTGWALAEDGKIIGSGVRDFSVKDSEHIGKRGIKFYNFLLTFGHVDEICYEKVQFTGNRKTSDGGELYKGFLMLVNMYAAGYGIPTFGTHPSTLKKAFAGHGRAEKETMCQIAREAGWMGGVEGTQVNHDEADAIALLIVHAWVKYGIKLIF